MLVILSIAKNLASTLAKSLCGILHCVQDDRYLWANCYIISQKNKDDNSHPYRQKNIFPD